MSLTRRTLLMATAGAMVLAALPPSGRAAPARPRITMLLWRGEMEVEQGFREELADLGIEARITVIDMARNLSNLPAALEAIRADSPDLVYTWGTGITLGTVGRWDAVDPARHLTEIPVLFTMVAAPWATGIAPPPGQTRPNVTGTTHIAPLSAQIAAIRAYRPTRAIGIVYNPEEPNSVSNVAELRSLSRRLDFTLLEAPIPGGSSADPAIIDSLVANLARDGAQVLYLGPDNFVGAHRHRLTEAGFVHGLPTFTATELEIRDGDALFGLVSRYDQVGRLTARKARAILVEGTPPGAIPVETLERFSYIVRMNSARRLDLFPPLPLLDYAEVIP